MTVPSGTSPDETEPVDVFGGYNELGLYVFGPAGMRCVLAVLIARSLLLVSGTSPDGERRAKVRNRAAELQSKYSLSELQALEVARRQTPRSGHPFYARPMKPANSGRKRRAA